MVASARPASLEPLPDRLFSTVTKLVAYPLILGAHHLAMVALPGSRPFATTTTALIAVAMLLNVLADHSRRLAGILGTDAIDLRRRGPGEGSDPLTPFRASSTSCAGCSR